MKDEIKEILYLEKYINKYKSDEKSIINGNRLTTPAMLDYLEVKNLLDCITNLQEENEKVHKELDYADNYNIYLISRIDKATEYIKQNSKCGGSFIDDKFVIEYIDEIYNGMELLNILKGDVNE